MRIQSATFCMYAKYLAWFPTESTYSNEIFNSCQRYSTSRYHLMCLPLHTVLMYAAYGCKWQFIALHTKSTLSFSTKISTIQIEMLLLIIHSMFVACLMFSTWAMRFSLSTSSISRIINATTLLLCIQQWKWMEKVRYINRKSI